MSNQDETGTTIWLPRDIKYRLDKLKKRKQEANYQVLERLLDKEESKV